MPIRERFAQKQFHWDARRLRTALGVAGTGGGTLHPLLGTVHTDTEVITPPDEGSLILANSTPTWDVLLHNDTAGCAMVSDATTWTMDQTPTWTGRHSWSDGAVQAYVDEDGTADFNGHVAIGANATVNSLRTLNTIETAVDTDSTYYGLFTQLTKTAGASDESDQLFGQYLLAELNQTGGTISYLYGVSAWARITDGQVGTSGAARYLRGLYAVADVDGGTVYDHAVAVHGFADHETGATVDGNLAGLYSQVDNDGTVNGSAILLWMDALSNVDWAIYCDDDVPTAHRGAATFGNVNAPAAQVDIDQQSTTAAIPVLMLDQGDISEQCIVFSSDSTDRNITLYTVDVTDTPTMSWVEASDALAWTKHLSLTAGNLYFASTYGISHADSANGDFLRLSGGLYVPGDIQAGDVPALTAEFLTLALSGDLSAERVFVAGDSLTGTDGGANGNYTLDLDTPGTLTVATANNAAAPHLHTITSSSNPGAAASILASDASGDLTLQDLTLAEYLYHDGDANTYIRFQADNITLEAGGVAMLDLVEAATDYIAAAAEIRVGSGPVVEIRSSGDLTTEADIWIDGDGGISAEGSLYALIDSDNSGTDAVFEVAMDADSREIAVSGTQLWTVFEDSTTMMRDGGVEHGATSVFKETDVFFQTQIAEAGAGGVAIMGGKDSGGVAGAAIQLLGLLDENADTTRSTAGRAVIEMYAGSESGGSWGNMVANGNVLAVRARVGGSWLTRLIVDEDGDMWVNGQIDASDAGIQTILATDDVTDLAPTDAELDTAFGTPATVGAGFVGLVDDNGAGARVWICASDGTNWWYARMYIAS